MGINVDGFKELNVSSESGGRVLILEWDHGKANEMGTPQLKELEQLVKAIEQSDEVIAMVSFSRRHSGKGTPIFIAGANVNERIEWDNARVKAHVRWQRSLLNRLRFCPIFHIGVVHGIALGWGTEYLLCCDYSIGTPDAIFGLPETGLGILPGAGGTSELFSQIGIANALRLGMAGERIGPEEAKDMGLIQECVSDLDQGMSRARSLAQMVARRSPTAVATYKQVLLECVGLSGPQRMELEAAAYEHCVDSGEARIGRENFGSIRKGDEVSWGVKKLMRDD
jgi:enoyl-CoA hydratase/carnithine racemase